MVVAVIGALLLAGCGGSVKPFATPSPAMTTYTDPTYHFSVTYDATVFRPESGQPPGIFRSNLYLRGKLEGNFLVGCYPLGAAFAAQMLAVWGKESLSPGSPPTTITPARIQWRALFSPNVTVARWVTVNGVRGERQDSKAHEPQTWYVLYHGSYTYLMVATSNPAQRATVTPMLEAVMSSFRIAK